MFLLSVLFSQTLEDLRGEVHTIVSLFLFLLSWFMTWVFFVLF